MPTKKQPTKKQPAKKATKATAKKAPAKRTRTKPAAAATNPLSPEQLSWLQSNHATSNTHDHGAAIDNAAVTPQPDSSSATPRVERERDVPRVSVGTHVRFTSEAGGAQYGAVIELATADGDPAARVAWVTGGESGPIPLMQLEVL